MRQTSGSGNPRRLSLLVKGAYWIALGIIAVMATASYLLLQQMLAAQQHDESLLGLASQQRALSQHVVYLASAASTAGDDRKATLVAALDAATGEFEINYEQLLVSIGLDAISGTAVEPGSIAAIFLGEPHHLDYFSTGLIANGRRLVSSLRTDITDTADAGYLAGTERAQLDETTALATMQGYAALSDQIRYSASIRLDRLLILHRTLFYATIGIIVLVAIFIFRPMSDVILRRTAELIEARNSMAYQAVHDGLTGLNNRSFLIEQFDALISGSKRRNERLAVIQLDLDRFKQINDTLGHAAGDCVLVAVAQRMRETSRLSDLCVRLGGDEFVMVLNGAGTTEDIHVVARRILQRINEPIRLQGTSVFPGASAGIAVYPVDADNAAELLVHADLALYAAKKDGGGTAAFFSDELRQELEHRKRLEQDMRRAIADEAFEVYFQPQVSLRDGGITGVEALVRWNHPVRGKVAPAEFIPVAEKSGLMASIGRIILRKAIAVAADWHRAGIGFGRLAVNVSGHELREGDFERFLFDCLETYGLPAEKLSLEIVESVILDDEKTGIAAKLRYIRAAGIHLELDDFGTGYASLSHVNPNEIDRLKIDRRFVQNIDANGDNTKIVRAITELARGLGISIIAEGAETEAELDSLLAIGCDQVQGYSIAFPMPPAAAGDWLATRTPKRPALTLVAGARA